MNWLAHVFLSEPDLDFRLGNLLADIVKGRDRHGMSDAFLRGTRCHQVIDAFTDFHPVVHRSRARVRDAHGRFAGILVDVFYDHFLARDWDRYTSEPLHVFTSRFYASIQAQPVALPGEARMAVERMIADDRLGSYRQIEGIEASLLRISVRLSARLGQTFEVERAIAELTDNDIGLAADFAEFFPQLRSRVDEWIATREAIQE
ncbi:MAG: ACP phosphodiesterase [Gemmataceae bacterium]|nr:ACP phosphodiesterase [Gemmataceae bacterium]